MRIGKKKGAGEIAPEVNSSESVSRDVSRKKKKDSLAAVLDESVIGTVIDFMKGVELCVTQKDVRTVYAGALFDAESVGGFGKKARSNEDKGSIIEMLRSGKIASYATADMLLNDKLFLILDKASISNIEDFGLLTGAEYTLAYITDEGELIETDKKLNYDDIKFIASEGIDAFLGSEEDDDAEVESPEDEDAIIEDDEAPFGDDEASYEEASEGDAEFDMDEANGNLEDDDNVSPDMVVSEPEEDNDEDSSELDAPSEPDNEVDNEEIPEPDVEISKEEYKEAIARVFYPNDLNLQAPPDLYDANFSRESGFALFDENRSEGWLNGYLNEISKAANEEINSLHNSCIVETKTLLSNLLSIHAEKVRAQMSDMDPESKYGKAKNLLEENFSKESGEAIRKVAEKREEINNNFEKSAKDAGESARVSAETVYRNRFTRQLQSDLQKVEIDVMSEIDGERERALRDLNIKRKEEASKLFDAGVSEILSTVSEVYAGYMDMEKEVFDRRQSEIKEFLESHKSDDIARINVLAEEQARANKAELLAKEHEAVVKAQREEFEATTDRLRADLEETRKKYDLELEETRRKYDERLNDEYLKNDKLQDTVKAMADKYGELDSKKDEAYKNRIEALKNENEALIDQNRHMQAVHKKAGIITVAFVIITICASLMLGALIGSHINVDRMKSDASTKIEAEYKQKLEKLEKKYEQQKAEKENVNKQPSQSEATQETPAAE